MDGVDHGAAKHAPSDLSASPNGQEGGNRIRSCALCLTEAATSLRTRRSGYDAETAALMIQPQDMAEAALFFARVNPKVAVHEIVLVPIRR